MAENAQIYFSISYCPSEKLKKIIIVNKKVAENTKPWRAVIIWRDFMWQCFVFHAATAACRHVVTSPVESDSDGCCTKASAKRSW